MGRLAKSIELLVAKQGSLQQQLITAEETNRKRQEYLDTYFEYNRKYSILDSRFKNLKTTNAIVMRILEKRRDNIIKSIEERTEAILAIILPEENYHVQITYTTRGKNYISEVFIGKDSGNGNIVWSRPKGTNGEFMKQLISFSILASINSLLGSEFLLMDEPFSSSDNINVSKMQPIIELMLTQGLQLLFIEHKHELYENIPHNIIQLIKHRSPSDIEEGYVEVLRNERTGDVNDEANAVEDSSTSI